MFPDKGGELSNLKYDFCTGTEFFSLWVVDKGRPRTFLEMYEVQTPSTPHLS